MRPLNLTAVAPPALTPAPQLPESRLRTCHVTMIHVDGSQPPIKYSVEVPSVGTVKDLLYALALVSVGKVWGLSTSCFRPRLGQQDAFHTILLTGCFTPQISGMDFAPASVAGSRVASVSCALDTLPAAVGACLPSASGPSRSSSPPPLPRPQDMLLLAKTSFGWQQSFEVFADVKARVSDIVPNEGGYNPELLVCYRYPSPEQGPANAELQQVGWEGEGRGVKGHLGGAVGQSSGQPRVAAGVVVQNSYGGVVPRQSWLSPSCYKTLFPPLPPPLVAGSGPAPAPQGRQQVRPQVQRAPDAAAAAT